MLLSAFTPFIITGLIKVLIILNTLPYAQINLDVDFTLEQTIFDTIFQAQSWIFLDILDAFLLIAWIPITMTIGIRELANSSTVRVYLSSILIGIVCSIVLFLLKPTILGLL
jgi:hypothetical protein